MGEIVRNIIFFLIIGGVLLVGVLYFLSELNAEGAASTEGLGSVISLALPR